MPSLSVVAAAAAVASVPKKDNTHSWSVATFETHRSALTNFLKTRVLPLLDANECRRVLIRAPVKSGKREMVEYLAMRDAAHNPTRVHAFVSAFHRTADESQRDELKNHNMHVFSLNAKAKAVACIQWIDDKLRSGKQVVLHLDECDFGSGDRQVLATVYNRVRNDDRVTSILYSATPQEVLFSGEVEDEEHQAMMDEMIHTGERIEYEPPSSFCGPARFLDAGLVTEATEFFRKAQDGTISLTPQGKEVMTGLRASIRDGTGRNILVLRLSTSELGERRAKEEKKAIYQFLKNWSTIPELSGCLIYADKDEKAIPSAEGVLKEKIQWSNKLFWDAKRADVPIIVTIDQTSSRSTEWGCHDRVYALHDFRHSLSYSTASQAQERINHYEGKYGGGFQSIKVYGHLKTFQLSAGRISYSDYLAQEWAARKVDRRTAQQQGLVGDYYKITRTNGGELHPLCTEGPVTESEKDRILQEIGSYTEVTVSARVRGGMKEVPVFATEFHACEPATFPALRATLDTRFGRSFDNPFTRSQAQGLENGYYKGYLRGWNVLDYETNVKTQPGWGVTSTNPRLTICYNSGTLGVAVRSDTGRRELKNTLETFKSIYQA